MTAHVLTREENADLNYRLANGLCIDARRKPGVESLVITQADLEALLDQHGSDATSSLLREIALHPDCELDTERDARGVSTGIRATRRGPIRVVACDRRVPLPRIHRRPGTSFRVHVADRFADDGYQWRAFTGYVPGSIRPDGTLNFGSSTL